MSLVLQDKQIKLLLYLQKTNIICPTNYWILACICFIVTNYKKLNKDSIFIYDDEKYCFITILKSGFWF